MEKITITYLFKMDRKYLYKALNSLCLEMCVGLEYFYNKTLNFSDKNLLKNLTFRRKIVPEILEVIPLQKDNFLVKIGIPTHNFNIKTIGFSGLLTVFFGQLGEINEIKTCKILDIDFPVSYLFHFGGPKFGKSGVLKFIKAEKFPLIGCILKPNIGLTPREIGDICYYAGKSGINLVKDDEIGLDNDISSIVKKIDYAENSIEKISPNSKIVYAVNICSDFDKLPAIAKLINQTKHCIPMILPFSSGFPALYYVRKIINKPIYTHRVGYFVYTQGRICIDESVLLWFLRLLGADFIHIGNPVKNAQSVKNLQKITEGKDILPACPVVTNVDENNVKLVIDKVGRDILLMIAGLGKKIDKNTMNCLEKIKKLIS